MMPINEAIAASKMMAKAAVTRMKQQRCVIDNVGRVLNYHMFMLKLEKLLRRKELTFALGTCVCCLSLLHGHSKCDNIIE
jgi:hypothetical protein